MTKTTLDESYEHQEGNHLWGATEYPFYDGSGQPQDIPCFPALNFTALIDERGDESRAILAAVGSGGHGLFSSFTADEARGLGKALMAMADQMEAAS